MGGWVDRYLTGADAAEILAGGQDLTARHDAASKVAESEARFRIIEKPADVGLLASPDLCHQLGDTVPEPHSTRSDSNITNVPVCRGSWSQQLITLGVQTAVSGQKQMAASGRIPVAADSIDEW